MPLTTAAIKIALAPALIGVATSVGHRLGPRAAGLAIALPLSSGPVVLVLALEHGPAFAAATRVGVILALVSLMAFCLAYAWAAQRTAWMRSSGAGVLSYLLCTTLLQRPFVTLATAFVAVCVLLFITLRAMPPDTHASAPIRAPGWDLPVRMVITSALVWSLSALTSIVGLMIIPLGTTLAFSAALCGGIAMHALVWRLTHSATPHRAMPGLRA